MESIPAFVSDYFKGLLVTHRITMIMCEPRKTWRGKWVFKNGSHTIYVTKDLPMDQFLLIMGHEIAHAITHDKYNHTTIKPHGKEWKDTFKTVMNPILNGHLSKEIEEPMKKFMKNPVAVIHKSDELINVKTVENMSVGSIFTLKFNNKVYRIIKKFRINWLCEELNMGIYCKIRGTAEIF
jgi:SprT protein